MDEKKENILLVVLAIILIIVVIALVFSSLKISKTGMATTTSQVVINAYVAIALSTDLAAGIDFGSLDPATDDSPAAENTNGPGGGTLYSVDVSIDSNVAADICIKDNMDLCTTPPPPPCAGDSIANANYPWSDNTDPLLPALPGTAMSTIYTVAGSAVPVGGSDYFRFWLSVPGGQAAGTYSNIVEFEGIPTLSGCP